jgi:hypothetical protein
VAGLRLKGADVSLSLILNSVVQATLSDILDSEFTFKTELLQEGYLGSQSDDYDEIFKGCHGMVSLNLETQDVFTFVQAVIARAQRQSPGTVINVKTTLNFPNGQKPRVMFPNVFVGPQPFNTGGRSNYTSYKFEFACSTFKIL